MRSERGKALISAATAFERVSTVSEAALKRGPIGVYHVLLNSFPLTPEQSALIIGALDSRFKRPCPSCDSHAWKLAEELAIVPVMRLNPSPPQMALERGFPLILVHCAICGYTQFHNPYVLKIASQLGLKPALDPTSGK